MSYGTSDGRSSLQSPQPHIAARVGVPHDLDIVVYSS
jgi:hypothetical protein